MTYLEVSEHLNETVTASAFNDSIIGFVPVLSSVVVSAFIWTLVRRSLYALSRGSSRI